MEYRPHRYQEDATEYILSHPICGPFIDMGLGKTVITLTAFDKLRSACEVRNMLVLGPIRVVEDVWPVEVAKWDHTKDLTCSVIRGSPVGRTIAVKDDFLDEVGVRTSKPSASAAAAACADSDIYLTNYENIQGLCAWLVKQKTCPFDMIVFDESTKMKSHSAKRFKLLKPFLHGFKRRVILTGGPTPNTYADLWAQIYLLDEGERLGQFFTHFKDRYFTQSQYSYEVKLKPGADKDIQKRIADITFSLKSEDHLDLPPIFTNTISLDFPQKLREKYDEFRKELAMALKNIEVEAFNAASLSNKCRQFTSGAVYETALVKTGKWEALHDIKLDAVEDVVEEANGEPVLIVYEFRHELERLRKRWPKAPWIGGGSKDASKAISDWNARKHRVMLVHPASIGHGVNLQAGGRIMVWASGTWSYDHYSQTVKRLHRQGQSGRVVVHRLQIRSTVDEVVWDKLDGKYKSQDELLTALKTHAK